MHKDIRKIVKELEAQGFTVAPTRKGHLEVRLDGKRVTTFPGSAGDHRSIKNCIADCRRVGGFVWPPKR